MASTEFEGWLGLDKDAVKGSMKWDKFEPKKWTEDDVDIEISHCGMCGSDLHVSLLLLLLLLRVCNIHNFSRFSRFACRHFLLVGDRLLIVSDRWY